MTVIDGEVAGAGWSAEAPGGGQAAWAGADASGASSDGRPDGTPADADTVRVVLVDDHALVREGLRSVLGHFSDIAIVAEADNAEAAVKAVHAHEPDVVVLDLQLQDSDGVEVMTTVVAEGLDPAVLVLSVQDDPDRVRDVLRAGARGYLLKTVEPVELADGIRRVADRRWVIGEHLVDMLVDAFIGAIPLGVPPVTPREHQVLRLLAEGLPNRAVAERLGISTRTAQKHVENLFKKFNVHSRRDLVVVAGRSGLLG